MNVDESGYAGTMEAVKNMQVYVSSELRENAHTAASDQREHVTVVWTFPPALDLNSFSLRFQSSTGDGRSSKNLLC